MNCKSFIEQHKNKYRNERNFKNKKKTLLSFKNRMPEARKAKIASKMVEMCIFALFSHSIYFGNDLNSDIARLHSTPKVNCAIIPQNVCALRCER